MNGVNASDGLVAVLEVKVTGKPRKSYVISSSSLLFTGLKWFSWPKDMHGKCRQSSGSFLSFSP